MYLYVEACLNCVAPEGCATSSLASLGIKYIACAELAREMHVMA